MPIGTATEEGEVVGDSEDLPDALAMELDAISVDEAGDVLVPDAETELPEVTPYGRNWDEVPNPRPPAKVTNLDPWPDDIEVPKPVATLKGWAERNGYTVRLGYSRGHKTGHLKADPWPLLEIIGAWCSRPGTNVVFSWERLPNGTNPKWKATTASFRAAGRVRAYGHLEGKRVASVLDRGVPSRYDEASAEPEVRGRSAQQDG